ncbi:SirB2 family protein [Marinimicrobium sp. C6131]|uniref:SirB2 family protein n=1 Tax=Marinimicrobium sp. C6131 TaxID=3022676 RepID=UPI00223CB0B3|nr:SirB2 family protein [Marinimicrobium sp. C6131]UZJ45858.1 SirB2 family protein [Marinimicrobium sp. C6131]
MIALLKHLHLTFVLLSFTGFFIRGLWMIQESGLLKKKWARVLPHINDTLLLISAIALAVALGYSPGDHPWLMTKIVALFVYIGVGVLAFRHPSKPIRIAAWLVALGLFLYIVSMALYKHPLGVLLAFNA